VNPAPERKPPSFWKYPKTVLRQIFRPSRRTGRLSLVALAACLLAAIACIFLIDQLWLDFAETWWKTTPLRKAICAEIEYWGDFLTYNVAVFVTLLLVGHFRKSRFLTRLAAASLISGMLAGGTARIAKHTIGRPRPNTVLSGKASSPSNFSGPTKANKWASMPSGHTATSIGVAVPILMAVPQIGIPIALVSVCITGSRVAGLSHYPSDVLAGAGLGIFFGIRSGAGLRKIRKKAAALKASARSKARPR